MKTMLVLGDMPSTCKECHFAIYSGLIGSMCVATDEYHRLEGADVAVRRPDWCPLCEMSENSERDSGNDYKKGYMAGYAKALRWCSDIMDKIDEETSE